MKTRPIILDHTQGIILDPSNPPFNNYQAFGHSYSGLKILADSVRNYEIKMIEDNPNAASLVTYVSSNVHPIIPCSFNWFSITIVNYLRLVALVDLMAQNNWKSDALADPKNKQTIRNHCTNYVRNTIPEIHTWRNKVAAHFAATDPFNDDTLGTLEQSIMNSVSYKYPYYHVGIFQWNVQGTPANLPTWALTETYERLRTRFWPKINLRPFPDNLT